jgi:hypothetical protein
VVGLDRAGCTVIELGPLAEAESTALVEAEIPVAADTARASQIVAMAEGNPFCGLELARHGSGDAAAIPHSAWATITPTPDGAARRLPANQRLAELVRPWSSRIRGHRPSIFR